MSAALERISDLGHLAPGFAQRLQAVLAECQSAGLDPIVYETLRTPERQAWLFAQGRTRPGEIVTNARSALWSWHGFGFAADVISQKRGWDQPDAWWQTLAVVAERHGLASGYRWRRPHDPPHLQWALCPVSPREADRRMAQGKGLSAVWAEYGADVVRVPAETPNVVQEAPAVPAIADATGYP